jgi:thioredoxin-dependent peroxiredoxin
MNRSRITTFGVALALAWAAGAAGAQQAAPVPPGVPAVGQMAPDFTVPAATRYGVLRDPVRLSDFRGQTVVIAFFIRARTKG